MIICSQWILFAIFFSFTCTVNLFFIFIGFNRKKTVRYLKDEQFMSCFYVYNYAFCTYFCFRFKKEIDVVVVVVLVLIVIPSVITKVT